ncbi:MAG: hypothetical protein JWR69_2343 [Pedosphaera sp.]|nr:hypothetical protein [Pedosphaera sp.]
MWLHLFEIYPEFAHLPLSERRKAANHAQQRALGHWQVLLTIVFTIASTVGLSVLDRTILGDQDGTVGALFGFFLGFAALHWAFYRYGLPHYREALQKRPPS